MFQMASKDPLASVIIALDVPSGDEALAWVKRLGAEVSFFKVGLELFTAAGPDIVRKIRDQGHRVFLDLKFHDIPTTVAKACESAVALGVNLLNLHTSGGRDMMQEASRSVAGRVTLLGVTRLTSDAAEKSTAADVVRLAVDAKSAGLGGVVCSAQEAGGVRAACGKNFVIVTPGIRLADQAANDQKRVATPEYALKSGADYIVLGRPILQASDPLGVLRKIRESFTPD